MFGCHLATLCARERSTVPSFVDKCTRAVESRGNVAPWRPGQTHGSGLAVTNTCFLAGLDIDGLYRVSGNLAVIQKLRFKADHGTVWSGCCLRADGSVVSKALCPFVSLQRSWTSRTASGRTFTSSPER